MTDHSLREIRLSDAGTMSSWLGDQTPLAARSGPNLRITQAGMHRYLKSLKQSPLIEGFVWEVDSETESSVLGFVFLEQTALRPGTLQIEFLLDPELSVEFSLYRELLDVILQRCGQDASVKVINLLIPEHYRALAKAVAEIPFSTADEHYPMGRSADGQAEEWMRTFTLSKTANWPYTWIFVPAPLGIIAVYGNDTAISAVKWLDYESFIEDVSMRELCIKDGFADIYGKMKSREEAEAIDGPAQRKIPEILSEAERQLRAYLKRELKDFSLPLATLTGTRFQRSVWQNIAQLPYGSTATYEEIGTAVAGGDQKRGRDLSRSVGMACGANPLVIFIPCHRVIAKDGKLQGYAYGVERKDYLLSLEMLGVEN